MFLFGKVLIDVFVLHKIMSFMYLKDFSETLKAMKEYTQKKKSICQRFAALESLYHFWHLVQRLSFTKLLSTSIITIKTSVLKNPPQRDLDECCPYLGFFKTFCFHTGVNKKPKKFKAVWYGFRGILKLSGRVNQESLKLSAAFSNTVCWTSFTVFV